VTNPYPAGYDYAADPAPDLGELQQRETDELGDTRLTVKVDEVCDPVRVQQLPARIAVMHAATVGTDTVKLFGEDLRRGRALVWALADTPALVHLGTREDEVTQGVAAQIIAVDTDGTAGAPMQIEMRHTEPLYARAATGTVTVAYLLEQWAD
jgi:hypothetical protein